MEKVQVAISNSTIEQIIRYMSGIKKGTGVTVRNQHGYDLDAIVKIENLEEANEEFKKFREFCAGITTEVARPSHLRPVLDEAIFDCEGRYMMISVTGGIYSSAQIGITIISILTSTYS